MYLLDLFFIDYEVFIILKEVSSLVYQRGGQQRFGVNSEGRGAL